MKWLTAFALIFGSSMAYADGGKFSVPNHPKWKEECGSCHIAYPPQLLTGDNWQRLMGGLDKHFDANAMLDAKDTKDILDFLQRYAGRGGRNSSTSLRITDTPWFTREHREVSIDTWSDPAVKSRANCTACHIKAERGDWSEDGVRMPGGRMAEEHDEQSERGRNKREHDRD